jgi:hypothetical protein
MEKRISSTEYRLGIYTGWPLNFQNVRKKFYADSLRINLLLQQVFVLIQKQCDILIPYSIINVYINNKIININYGYFPLIVDEDVKFDLLFETESEEDAAKFAESDNVIKTIIIPLLQAKLKKNFVKKKKFPVISKNKLQIRFFRLNKQDKTFVPYKAPIISKKPQDKRRRRLKNNLKLFYFEEFLEYFFIKWHRFVIEQIFAELFKRNSIVQNINLKTYFLQHYNTLDDTSFLFNNVKDWYKKIGGNLKNFMDQLLPLHYSLIYKNFMPLVLLKLRNDLEQNPYRHRGIMTTFYNLLVAYKVMQDNISGLKLTFKGSIGQHGRTKTLHFFFGRLYTFELSMPVEYCAANANTIFGTIGIRWWINYHEERFEDESLKQLLRRNIRIG